MAWNFSKAQPDADFVAFDAIDWGAELVFMPDNGWQAVVANHGELGNDRTMQEPSSRSIVARRVVIAHLVGLWTTGMVGTIGTTAGFSVGGGGLGLFLGGLLSLPWMIALAIVIRFDGGWIERHPFLFAVIGPVVVCASYALLAGAFLDAAAVSTTTSSVCYSLLVLWSRFRSAAVDKV